MVYGVTIASGPVDWQIVQQVGGKADIELAGSYKKRKKVIFKKFMSESYKKKVEKIYYSGKKQKLMKRKVSGKSEWKTFRQEDFIELKAV